MEISMPPSLRDVRVVSPAVNLPRRLAAAMLIAGYGFAEQHGLIPRARFRALAIAGMDPVVQSPPPWTGSSASPDDSSTSTAAPPPSSTRPAQPARMLTGLLCELERSQSRYGLQAICGTASTAVIERP
jgi:acetyl-CoA acyltransferase